jgi:uncharacterized RmlC-like cupin family protein
MSEVQAHNQTTKRVSPELPKLQCKILPGTPYQVGVTQTKTPHRLGTGGKPIQGITTETTGAREITLSLFEIAPGEEDGPVHIHEHETSGYVISGEIGLMYGDDLEIYEVAPAGSFIFVPPNVPHFIENHSKTEPCAVLVTRFVTETESTAIILPEMDRARLERKQTPMVT